MGTGFALGATGGSKCLMRARHGTAAICLRQLDHNGWAFRLTGFKPRSTYRVTTPGFPLIDFRTKLDLDGSTDGRSSGRLFINKGGPGAWADIMAEHGFLGTGTDRKDARIRFTVSPGSLQ